MSWAQNLSVLMYMELFLGTLKVLNLSRLMINIARQITHTYNKERKLAPSVKKLIYKYVILNVILNN